MKTQLIQEIFTNKVTVANIFGFAGASIISQLESVSAVFTAAQPILSGTIALSVIAYNVINIKRKLKEKNNG